MKEKFIQDCISLFEREDIKNNLKTMINPLVQPIVSILLKEINPYIFLRIPGT